MAFRLEMITTDSADPGPLARWWGELLGGEVISEADGWFYIVDTPIGRLAFQRVVDPTQGKNLLHLDLTVDDGLDAAVRRVTDAGGSVVAEHTEQGFHWVTVADPQGNQFCLSGPHDLEGTPIGAAPA